MTKISLISTLKGTKQIPSTISREYTNNKDIHIVYECKDLDISIEAENHFPFIALQSIRTSLDKQNILLMCKGSRVDVYPSGGLLSGTGAIRLTIGKQVKIPDDLVKIFDPEDDPSKLGSVLAQEKYYKDWLESINPGNSI